MNEKIGIVVPREFCPKYVQLRACFEEMLGFGHVFVSENGMLITDRNAQKLDVFAFPKHFDQI